MKRFAQLIQELETSNKTNDKIEALVNYFQSADEQDRVWVIALFTGKKPKRPVNSSLLKMWACELSGTPEWLFNESYHNVGDLSETIALILPRAASLLELPLNQWIAELQAIEKLPEDEKKTFILNAWNHLATAERFIFNKLISGNFRIGVSAKTLVNSLAKKEAADSNKIMHSIMGKWDPYTIAYEDLVGGSHVNTDNSWPYPFCLAYALEQEPATLGPEANWQAEWKWDGIRGQIIKRNDELFIWSRGEELITDQFPELHVLAGILDNGTVLDGEILAARNGQVLPFSTLQQRLNRKTISKKQLEDAPIGFFAYDLLEHEGRDIRDQPLRERRKILEEILSKLPPSAGIVPSQIITYHNWADLATVRESSRDNNSEGVMLKNLDSLYHSGRKRGDWWKWKVNPYTVDTVMIYAQKGAGRRANFFTDYTFAVRDGENLITIAKAYSGLTDQEIRQVDAFVKRNAIEKFGPVRTVKPELVFEIAFEGIAESKRHKAGLALRFPRILRWRKDKTAAEINTLDDLRQLLLSSQALTKAGDEAKKRAE
ncbi:ATP-dependent DNA ligase [Pedobacter yulinensis]|uniref:DNA ligase (ATP) n=1 Tax=Pedobacter yulinensis TaxID=2126353 RepID=A0A2T3HLK6_9SPHI|nr:ATP-dependent DNA ligase [Pedobacter yulinensis]PST83320.1 ATP-dependent DNA ligase [Pedobacter yulinensis]